jgi:hypothetical protein
MRHQVWLVLLALQAGLIYGQTAPAESGLQIGFEERVRTENWNNITDYNSGTDDEREQIRYRTRVWASAPVGKGISFLVGMVSETNQNLAKDPYFDEVLFENAYLTFEKLGVRGLSLRVGRQGMNRGNGFILMDGTSGDGSRTSYFNGFDLTYKTKKSTLELIGISDPFTDRYFPALHSQHKTLQSWDERALGVYYTDRHLGQKTAAEAYYFFKEEVNDRSAVTSPLHQRDRFLHTLGSRISAPLAGGWLASGEAAGQWGHQAGNKPIRAWGGYAFLKKTLPGRWAPYLQAGVVGLSGSDPNDPGTIRNWDPLFSRWPKWSELLIYSEVPESGVGYATNLKIAQFEGGIVPNKRVKARVTYNRMGSFHSLGRTPQLFGSGTLRGDNIQARVDVTVNRFMLAHVVYEHMAPGSYYAGKDPGNFLRVETSFAVPNLLALGRMSGKH